MQREIIVTADGSHTVQLKDRNITYHSHHGAVQESKHVFIEAGFLHREKQLPGTLRLFEMGFGTGLNALLTLTEAKKLNKPIVYSAIENYPLTASETGSLNYNEVVPGSKEVFERLHQAEWNKKISITPFFTLNKINADLLAYTFEEPVDLIYYDAFAPTAQPELWTLEVFQKLYALLAPGGVLVTYCSKGDVRRAMMAAGFLVEKLPGPKGKREMVRASRSTMLDDAL